MSTYYHHYGMKYVCKHTIIKVLLIFVMIVPSLCSLHAQEDEHVFVRANLLRWVTLTPDIGVEWQVKKDWSVLASATWTRWSFKNNTRRYALKEFAGEVRHYMGYMSTELPWYVGLRVYGGQFNYGFTSAHAKQGDIIGGGITAGYRLHLRNKKFYVDFTGGLGCTHASYENYKVLNGTRYLTGRGDKNYWGINHLSIALVMNIL